MVEGCYVAGCVLPPWYTLLRSQHEFKVLCIFRIILFNGSFNSLFFVFAPRFVYELLFVEQIILFAVAMCRYY